MEVSWFAGPLSFPEVLRFESQGLMSRSRKEIQQELAWWGVDYVNLQYLPLPNYSLKARGIVCSDTVHKLWAPMGQSRER